MVMSAGEMRLRWVFVNEMVMGWWLLDYESLNIIFLNELSDSRARENHYHASPAYDSDDHYCEKNNDRFCEWDVIITRKWDSGDHSCEWGCDDHSHVW